MRNITLRAKEDLIERAELRAARENTTLNAAFGEWLSRYANRETAIEEYAQLTRRFGNVQSSGRISRNEMNER
jgi:hypothetical protein